MICALEVTTLTITPIDVFYVVDRGVKAPVVEDYKINQWQQYEELFYKIKISKRKNNKDNTGSYYKQRFFF